ncbi:MAG: carboxylating nicotinate-nucleotide diphosphorylase [Acidobacteria bacterium]|nr:MAG: carboxylating nicotinate-nucleotide diphosphorylase [Acidobacteriota bacterium]PYQ64842.1 MAG: carboxylating nicotinate-nucleotide diphosphorylase [Acidobacteriota bacterium]
MDGLSPAELDAKLREFLAEDVGPGDVTTDSIVPPDAVAAAEIVAKSDCVVSGLAASRRLFELLDPGLTWEDRARPGSKVPAGTTLARLSGKARAILTGERVALNLLQRMCGIATATHLYVDAVAGTGCRILGTRKTAPGLRAFDRLAVRDGGAADHRFGLFDRILVKDNHRVIAGGVAAALEAVSRNARANVTVEVEVESEEDLREALRGGVRILLIDNQTAETVARWKAIVREAGASAEIEASGDMTLARVRDYASAGADSISVGRITHSVEAADISLEISSPAEGMGNR